MRDSDGSSSVLRSAAGRRGDGHLERGLRRERSCLHEQGWRYGNLGC